MTSAGSVHFTAYQAEYEAVLARARHVVACYPPLLGDLAEPLHPQWGQAAFSRIVALLPYWVADLLDRALPLEGSARLSRPEETKTLALANLLGWWSYLIQDGLLDRELEPAEFLPLSMALHASAVRLLTQLLPGHPSFWEAFERLSLSSSEACAWEQQRRLEYLNDLDAYGPGQRNRDRPHRGPAEQGRAGPAPTDQGRIADRSSLLQLAVVAQFALRGLEQEHPLCTVLTKMLRHYAIARQIGDDRSDWAQDLQNGQLNHVSTRLARRMLATGAIESFAELDVERMMGHYLYDDELFASIQQEAMAACQRAAQCIAPYRSRPLDSLVSELAQQLERGYRDALESRRRLQAVFAFERCRSRHDL
jgi:hypothetical protein